MDVRKTTQKGQAMKTEKINMEGFVTLYWMDGPLLEVEIETRTVASWYDIGDGYSEWLACTVEDAGKFEEYLRNERTLLSIFEENRTFLFKRYEDERFMEMREPCEIDISKIEYAPTEESFLGFDYFASGGHFNE